MGAVEKIIDNINSLHFAESEFLLVIDSSKAQEKKSIKKRKQVTLTMIMSSGVPLSLELVVTMQT